MGLFFFFLPLPEWEMQSEPSLAVRRSGKPRLEERGAGERPGRGRGSGRSAVPAAAGAGPPGERGAGRPPPPAPSPRRSQGPALPLGGPSARGAGGWAGLGWGPVPPPRHGERDAAIGQAASADPGELAAAERQPRAARPRPLHQVSGAAGTGGGHRHPSPGRPPGPTPAGCGGVGVDGLRFWERNAPGRLPPLPGPGSLRAAARPSPSENFVSGRWRARGSGSGAACPPSCGGRAGGASRRGPLQPPASAGPLGRDSVSGQRKWRAGGARLTPRSLPLPSR